VKKKVGRLCVITDVETQNKYSHIELTKLAIKGGADIIQFRDKKMPTCELIKTAIKMKRLCDSANVLFIVNDRVDVAMISNADGVHLGQDDIPTKEARRLLGNNKIIGKTAHNLLEALKNEIDGADYIGFGHIFTTNSKIRNTKPKGTKKLNRICSKLRIPVLAIGGIGPGNVHSVMSTGVHGIAVIGSVVKSDNPSKAVSELKRIVYEKKS
jgi:thiamine-phosphate pyrophosphorylase